MTVELPPRDMLRVALDLAAQGFRVFPLIENGRTPALFGWNLRASYDPDKVRAMWSSWDPQYKVERVRAFNVGIATGRTRDGWVTVFDVDVKAGGKGRESVAALDLLATDDWLSTKRVETLSGGDHLYFETDGPLANTCSKLGPNIDTRGEGGFVVAAGSVVNGRSYIDHGGAIRKAPDWMVAQIGAAADRAGDNVVLCMLDTPPAIERATNFLETNADLAVEGSGGNFTTLKVAARVKDFGLSEQGCCELLFTKWNDRCSPPWEWEELAVVVANAYRYGQNPIGSSSPEADFDPVDPNDLLLKVPGKKAAAARVQMPGFDFAISAEALMGMQFPEVRWVVEGLIPEGLTILAGAPKIGKSWLVLELATETGVGGRLVGQHACSAGPALLLALEDNPRRLQDRFRKMKAAAAANVSIRTAWRRLDDGGVQDIAAWIDANPGARLVIIDTLAKVKPPGRRGANSYDTDSEALAPLQRLALERQIAVVIVHHVRKLRDPDDWMNQVSGSNGLSGVADTIAMLTRPRGAGQRDARLQITGRDVEEKEIDLKFDDSAGRWRVADRLDDDFGDVTPERRSLLKLIVDAGATGLALSELATAVGKSTPNVSKMLNGLRAEGLVNNLARGRWCATSLI